MSPGRAAEEETGGLLHVTLAVGAVGGGGKDGSGVGGGMDGGQSFRGHPGVDVGGGQVPVAEQLLDVADVGPPFDHQGGRGVAEQVAAPGLARSGGVDVVVDLAGQPPAARRSPLVARNTAPGSSPTTSWGRASVR